MEKSHIKHKKLPKLFCDENNKLILKKLIQLNVNGEKITFEQGTVFNVIGIVGYGFDLLASNYSKEYQIRILNSEMPNYFEIDN